MGVDESECTGVDDIPFDKFKNEASRCKNFNGETKLYWTDTPSVSYSTYFSIVSYSGIVGSDSYHDSNSHGVCPIFKLSKDK